MAVTSTQVPLDEMLLPGPETRYAWVIDKDHKATCSAPAMIGNRAGTAGPKGRIGLPIDKPDKFRIVDAEGAPLLEGRTNAASISEASDGSVDGFEPLDDIGIGKYIEYLVGEKWVRLVEGR